jgi:hypothetical protein
MRNYLFIGSKAYVGNADFVLGNRRMDFVASRHSAENGDIHLNE